MIKIGRMEAGTGATTGPATASCRLRRYRPAVFAILAILGVGIGTPALCESATSGSPLFDRALHELQTGDNDDAAAGFFASIQSAAEGEQREWARLLLATALAREGFSHAAVENLIEVGRNRAAPELLPAALREILKLRSAGPILESRVLDRLVLDTDLGFLEPRMADYVHFENGNQDYRNGDVEWAEREFGRLTPDSLAFWKAEWVRALWSVDHDRLDAAEEHLRHILVRLAGPRAAHLTGPASPENAAWRPPDWIGEPAAQNLLRDAWRTLSRVLYEQKRFREAAAALETLSAQSAVDGARLLLEKAWCAYFLGDPQTVLGHLYALAAPIYREAFLPERFALAGLTYKNLCHYDRAQAVVMAFRGQYGVLVEEVRAHRPIADHPIVKRVLQADASIRSVCSLLTVLRAERERARHVAPPLGTHLLSLYETALATVTAEEKHTQRQIVERLTRELFEYDENMNLLEYEVGTDRFRRMQQRDYLARGPVAAASVPLWDEAIYFRADGEYWNEELDLYRVHIDDRCAWPRNWE